MKTKAIIPLALGVVVGGIAIKYVVDVVKRAKGSTAAVEQVDVVVANSDIQQQSAISKEMVKLVKSPRTPLLSGDRLSKVDDVVGRVTAKSIPQGAPILNTMLAPPGSKPGLQVNIPPGHRAVSVKTDEVTGVAYQLKPGDYVDVLVVMDTKKTGGQRGETISQVILQRVAVGAVGQESGDAKDGSTVKAVKSVTLFVPESDVPKLHLAQIKGKVTLAMRGEDDLKNGTVHGARESELTGEGKTPDPSAVPDPALALATPTPAPAPPTKTPKGKATPAPVAPPDGAEGPPPHTVTVINSLAHPGGGAQMRVTFESAHSSRIVSISDGLTRGSPSMPPAPSSSSAAGSANRFGSGMNAYPQASDDTRRDPVDENTFDAHREETQE